MRKAILIGLVISLIVSLTGYATIWYMQASQSKKVVENAIASLNVSQPYFTYESIQTTGFPKAMNLIIEKPRFHGRVDRLLKELAHQEQLANHDAELARHIENLPEWEEDLQLEGRLILGINALSDQYSVAIDGNFRSKSKLVSQTFDMNTVVDGVSNCSLAMQRSKLSLLAALWDFEWMMHSSLQDFLRDFKALSCDLPARKTIETTSNETVVSSAPSYIRIASEIPRRGWRGISVNMKMADVVMAPRMDAIFQHYFKSLVPGEESASNVNFSAYGKQNFDLEASYSGPDDFSTDGKDIAINAEIKKFTVSNALYNSNVTLSLYNETTGDKRAVKIAQKSDLVVNEAYNRMLGDVVKSVIGEIFGPKGPKHANLPPSIAKYSTDELYHLFEPIVPRLNEFGTISQGLTLNYQGNREMTNGDYELGNLEFSTTPYGLRAGGTVTVASAQPIPSGTLDIAWQNPMRMIDDVFAYAAKLEKTMEAVAPDEAKTVHLDPELMIGLKSFLTALAETETPAENKDTLHFVLSNDSSNNITVNAKPMDKIMALYQQHLAPVLSKPQEPPAE